MPRSASRSLIRTLTPLCWDHPVYARTCAEVCVWLGLSGEGLGHTGFIPRTACTGVVAMPIIPALGRYRQEDQE